MEKNWQSLEELFDAIKNEKYIVLRNYETLYADVTNAAHPDIDFLCENMELFCKALCAVPKSGKDDGVHYKIFVADKKIDIDLRHLGDGYYDLPWEQELLEHRELFEGGLYVPDHENYFYSLLYHALIQKFEVSADYQMRLAAFDEKFDVSDRLNMVRALESYMREKGYRYTYPKNPRGIFNLKETSKDLVEKNLKKKIRKKIYNVLRFFNKRILGR